MPLSATCLTVNHTPQRSPPNATHIHSSTPSASRNRSQSAHFTGSDCRLSGTPCGIRGRCDTHRLSRPTRPHATLSMGIDTQAQAAHHRRSHNRHIQSDTVKIGIRSLCMLYCSRTNCSVTGRIDDLLSRNFTRRSHSTSYPGKIALEIIY
jgi:hypothetical protein